MNLNEAEASDLLEITTSRADFAEEAETLLEQTRDAYMNKIRRCISDLAERDYTSRQTEMMNLYIHTLEEQVESLNNMIMFHDSIGDEDQEAQGAHQRSGDSDDSDDSDNEIPPPPPESDVNLIEG